MAGSSHSGGYAGPTAAPVPPLLPLSVAVLLLCVVALVLLLSWWRQASRAAARCARLTAELEHELAQRARTDQALAATQASLCHLAAQRRNAGAAERQRIGRDIHDDLGQHLLALQLDIGSLHSSAQLPVALRQHTARIERQIGLTVRSLRTVINDLRPAALDIGLAPAAQRQLDEIARLAGLRCELRTAGLERQTASSPSAAAESAVFRLLQEALSNVVRHARASAVHVTLAREDAGFILAVRDDGVGFGSVHVQRGTGLTGMADRVAAAGGRMTLDSQPGRGTTVSITLPDAPLPLPAVAEYCA